jgi:hypothetical protein
LLFESSVGGGTTFRRGGLSHIKRREKVPSSDAMAADKIERADQTAVTAAIALLQDAMPRPGLPLVRFNDNRCGTVAELRSFIVKARRFAHDTAERERAAAAVKAWLLVQIMKKQAATAAADIAKSAPDELLACERLARACRLRIDQKK